MILADYREEDRIEHIHSFSHCRCRNKIEDGNHSCKRYHRVKTEPFRKVGLPENQLCIHSSDQGYCRLSRIDEVALIKRACPEDRHLIVDRIVTEKGLKLLKTLKEA